MILIKSGTVLVGDRLIVGDVLTDRDTIVEVGVDLRSPGADVIEADGCLIGPGLVDIHVHLREPGHTWKEDVESGSRAAAAGGFTAVVAMPNTEPPIDEPKVAEAVRERGAQIGLVDVFAAGALTMGRAGMIPSDLRGLYESGVRIFSDDGDSVADTGLLARIMDEIADLPGAVVAQHAEDASMTSGGHMHAGEVSASMGLVGLPAEAETSVVRRDLELVRGSGAPYHCQHVSAAGTLELLRKAKAEGLPVTAEVTPHHLSFTEHDVAGLDPNFKMYPPLRTAGDRRALRQATRDGLIDAVATDHAPHADDEKAEGFEQAPRGVTGLETAASVVWELVADPTRLFEVLSIVPASIAGLARHGRLIAPGEPANIVVFDPAAEWAPAAFESKSANSPYAGTRLRGKVRATIHDGKVTYRSKGEM